MHFKELEVWQKSYQLCVDIYKEFSHNRDYGFKDQITRSALSVPSNIAEGFERSSLKEKIRFVSIAKGSAGELTTQLMIAKDINYLAPKLADVYLVENELITKMLGALIQKLSLSLKNNTNL
ncbi:four helix bundle protein [Thalassotalea sp. ND16A]|uniref:four helix bundle protein n=1 Tax=Thalassotalea sp. ND16A TaxID=1535422 RepID=UPI00051A3524|nr:four helix bundle protein [Thalassotalea sp. ND16A]KGJ97156.1 hypothetical protein ND16A_0078 [Thalassotalea sp. ND16A]